MGVRKGYLGLNVPAAVKALITQVATVCSIYPSIGSPERGKHRKKRDFLNVFAFVLTLGDPKKMLYWAFCIHRCVYFTRLIPWLTKGLVVFDKMSYSGRSNA